MPSVLCCICLAFKCLYVISVAMLMQCLAWFLPWRTGNGTAVQNRYLTTDLTRAFLYSHQVVVSPRTTTYLPSPGSMLSSATHLSSNTPYRRTISLDPLSYILTSYLHRKLSKCGCLAFLSSPAPVSSPLCLSGTLDWVLAATTSAFLRE